MAPASQMLSHHCAAGSALDTWNVQLTKSSAHMAQLHCLARQPCEAIACIVRSSNSRNSQLPSCFFTEAGQKHHSTTGGCARKTRSTWTEVQSCSRRRNQLPVREQIAARKRNDGSEPADTSPNELEGSFCEEADAHESRHTILATVLAIVLALQAPPSSAQGLPCESVSSYYAPLAGLQGQALKSKLHDIVMKDAKSFSYVQVWDALKVLDAADAANPAASADVNDIYSRRTMPKSTQGLPEGWNREHLWPRSYGLPAGKPEFTDLHNLRPADTNVNSARGNKPFGECSRESDSTCLVPANREAGSDTAANRNIWTPPGEVRGDIARALFYMAVRYEGDTPGTKDLELSDEPSIELARMGRLSTLLKWHAADPPSASERLRNERVCTLFQHNRNPFVDRPELVVSIWGANQGPLPLPANRSSLEPRPEPTGPQPGSSSSTEPAPPVPAGVPASGQRGAVWVNEFHYNNTGKDEGEFVEVAIGADVDPQDVIVHLYNGANGGVYRMLAVRDSALFQKGEVTSDGVTLYVCQLPPDGLQNGPADGIAVTVGDRLVDFVSYEGTLTAASGPAKNSTSTPIGVRESEKTEKGSSVGVVDSVKKLWQIFRQATPGSQNR